MKVSERPAKKVASDDQRWRAVVGRDCSADGLFVYAVRTTGVYCRPSCAARLARRENVCFYATPKDAERAGFRACKRCQPQRAALRDERAAVVTKACELIEAGSDEPGLAELAGAVGWSKWHFHRVFKSLTGLTPKEYATAHRSRRVRSELARSKTVTTAVYDAGFRSSGRFYATSDKALGMTPTTFRAGGKGAAIRFAVGQCPLGAILVAASDVGICEIALGDETEGLVSDLQKQFPNAELVGGDGEFEKWVAKVVGFVERPAGSLDLPLDLQGTAFQQRVWQMLCKIPRGKTASYAEIAKRVGRPNAVRAVGQAIAANKIAVAIPCHRVIRTDGALSGYRWGVERKAALLERERGKK